MSSIRGSSWLRTAQGLGSGRRGAAYGKLPPVRPPQQRATGYGKLAPVRPPTRWPGGSPLGQDAPREPLLRRLLSRQSPLRKLDYVLLAAVLALSLVGTLLVWSATQPGLISSGSDPKTYLFKQLLNIALGLIFMLTVSLLDYRQLRLYAPFLYGASCLGLLVVLTPLGSTVNGAHSWISLVSGFQIEPSEFAKLAIILMTAIFLSELRQSDSRPRLRALAAAIGCAAFPIGLVVLEPDLGVVILMVVLLVGLIALSGIRLWWLGGVLAAGTAVAIAALKLHLLKAYQLGLAHLVRQPVGRPQGHRVQRGPGQDRHWLRRPDRAGPVPRPADRRKLRARAAHRLHLRGGGRGTRLHRRRAHHRAAGRGAAACATDRGPRR